jgi:hypothetical protein
MRLNFCTLFNSAYLSRGIVLYESLVKHCPDFHLYVFAFDNKTFEYLSKANYKHITPISLKDFEDQDLLKVKPTRSAAEYCWTCTPSTILYCLTKFKLENCTYVDADMCFYSDPNVLVKEMGENSVLITEHRYTAKYDQTKKSGKYCVQFITVFNNAYGLQVINWWRDSCIEWCYARHEDGKFGDQKYLDVWPQKFTGVHELQHLGGGIAPWNVQQYIFELSNGKLIGTETVTGKKFEAVFFHFHSLKFFDDDMVLLTDPGYDLSNNTIELLFKPYVRLLNKAKQEINAKDNSFNPNGSAGAAPYGEMGLGTVLKYYMNGLRSSKRNILGKGLPDKLKHHYFFKASCI